MNIIYRAGFYLNQLYIFFKEVILMDTIVLKFGGSSLSDNEKLKLVANKITDLYDKGHQIVVVLSAQGKTTDNLINQAAELSDNVKLRELDTLLSSR